MTSQFELTKVNVKFEDLKKCDDNSFSIVKKVLSYLSESKSKHKNLFIWVSAMAKKICESFVKFRKGEISKYHNICNILKLYKENLGVENDFAMINHLRGQLESTVHRAKETLIYGRCEGFLHYHKIIKNFFDSMEKPENNFDDAEKFNHKILKGEYDDDVEMYQFEGANTKEILIKIAMIQLLRVLILMEEKACEKRKLELLNVTLISVYQFLNSILLEDGHETFERITGAWKLNSTSSTINEMKQFMEIEFLSESPTYEHFVKSEEIFEKSFENSFEQYELILFNKWKADCVVKMHQNFNTDVTDLIWVQLFPKARTIAKIEEILKTESEYYTLLKEWSSSEQEKFQVFEIMKEFFNIKTSVEHETTFCKELREVLQLSYSVYPELFDQIKAKEFSLKQLSAKELIENVKKIKPSVEMDDDLRTAFDYLQATSADHFNAGVYYVIGLMRDELKNLHIEIDIKIEISDKDENGMEKKILTADKKLMVLSKEKAKIEQKLSDVKQVVFISDFFDIDDNLDRELWHGKNIEVFADRIYIRGERIWNLSGNGGEALEEEDAGQNESTGTGLDGKHGHAGESGGILRIDVEKRIQNGKNWKIISFGGQGGDGQNGGAGRDGVNGIDCTIDDVKADLKINHLTVFVGDWEQRKRKQGGDSGCKYIAHFLDHSLFRSEQLSYCIGTDGTNGKQGGAGGRSGQGGFPGEVTLTNQQTMMKVTSGRGSDGIEGKPGTPGANGKTGRDMGMSKKSGESGEFVGNKAELKLRQKEYDRKQENSIYSEEFRKYIGFEVIKPSEIPKNTTVAEVKNKTTDRKNHAIALHNLLIPSSKSLKTKLNTKIDFEKMLEALSEALLESEGSIVESLKNEKDKTYKIIRQQRSVSAFQQLLHACQSETSSEIIFKQLRKMELSEMQCLELHKAIFKNKIVEIGVERFINRDKSSTFLDPIIEDYFKLMNIPKPAGKTFLQILRSRKIFKSFVSFLKQNSPPCCVEIFRKFFAISYEYKDVDMLLIEKYKQASLKTVQLGKFSENLKIDISEISTRSLIPDGSFDSDIKSKTFGDLNNYFDKNIQLSDTFLKLDKEQFTNFVPSILQHLKQDLKIYPDFENVEESVGTSTDVILLLIKNLDMVDIKASESFQEALAKAFAINLKLYEIDFNDKIQLKQNFNQALGLKTIHVLNTSGSNL